MEEQTAPTNPPKVTCVSCGAKLKGDYCRKCGEKKIIPERDFRLTKFLSQSLWHFARFDSKLLQSAWILFIKPGFLTSEWIAGRRVMYMKPLQLFIIASVLFYFFLPKIPIYYISPVDLISGYAEGNFFQNALHYDFEKLLSEKVTKYTIERQTLLNHITITAGRQSKTWLFLIIPVWGSLIYLLFVKKIPWLSPHLIFAMHGLTFYMLADLVIHAVLNILNLSTIGFHIFLFLNGILLVYQLFAVRRVYKSSWFASIVKTLIIMAGFVTTVLLYRQVITITTLWLTSGNQNWE